MRFYWDQTYILVIIGAIISMIASWNVKRTYKKYSDDYNSRGIQAQDVAVSILRNAGITDVAVERIKGDLTDHYSPKEKVLRLSDSVYGSTSVAAIGVAAQAQQSNNNRGGRNNDRRRGGRNNRRDNK